MADKIFGTDGIRGRVGEYPITADFVLKLGWAAGQVLTRNCDGKKHVLIGKDTRVSGYMFESTRARLSGCIFSAFLVLQEWVWGKCLNPPGHTAQASDIYATEKGNPQSGLSSDFLMGRVSDKFGRSIAWSIAERTLTKLRDRYTIFS